MKKLIRNIGSLSLGILLFSCADEPKNSSIEVPEISFTKEGELYLIKNEDTIKTIDIEIADDDYQRATGLMYRKEMKDDRGMLFIFPLDGPRSFYMKNTYIPLDIIYYSKDSTMVSAQENAATLNETSLPSEGPAKYVLELNAGKVQEWNIEKGDKFSFRKTDQ